MKALILAAGVGSRLAPITDAIPKSLVPVGGTPILFNQIEALHENGVFDITVISGYKADVLKSALKEKYPDVNVIKSDCYATTNNMYSAYLGRDAVGEDELLMMNADVFFDSSVISALLEFEHKDAIAVDVGRYLDEAMKVVARDGIIVEISKQIPRERALGSSVDIYKLSKKSARAFFDKCTEYIEKRGELKKWSEVALSDILPSHNFKACPLVGRWIEIDNHDDLREANILFARQEKEMKDYFGLNADALKSKKLFLFDMDGTIYNENTLFDGTLQILDYIKKSGGKYVFITNNSSKSVDKYVEKLGSMGIFTTTEDFFTSVGATALLLNEKHPGAKVYCQGTKALIEELISNGIRITEEIEDDIDVVLVGFDTELTSEKLRKTCFLLGRDVAYYGTNPDVRCPVSFGYVPDCASICEMLYNCTGKRPHYIGKPEPTMVDFVCKKLGIAKKDAVIIGDRLYTDIATGVNAGVDSICVLSGEATLDDIENGTVKPTFIFENVKVLYEELTK